MGFLRDSIMAPAAERLALWALRLTSDERTPTDRRIPYSGRTTAGVYIDANTALKISTVWACRRFISQSVASLPWRVMRQQGERQLLAPTHPVDYLLHVRPNPEWSPFQFKETMTSWAMMRGNAYAEIEPDMLGRPFNLWPIHPDRVCPMRDIETGELYYDVQGGGAGEPRVEIEASRMFHLRGYGEGPVGLNVIQYAAESLGWAAAAQVFGAAFFGNGMNLGGVIEVPKGTSQPARDEIELRMDKYRGPKKSGKWAVLDAGIKANPLQIDPDKGQFIETNQHLVEEICRWFGTPPHKVMHLLRATFSNIEQQSIEVVQDALTPWVLRSEEEANYKFFGQNRLGFYTKMNMRALLRGDFKSQQEGFEVQRRNGILNADEWRALTDQDPIGPAKGGDKYLVQAQMIDLKSVGQGAAAKPTVPAADPLPAMPANIRDELMAMVDEMEFADVG